MKIFCWLKRNENFVRISYNDLIKAWSIVKYHDNETVV